MEGRGRSDSSSTELVEWWECSVEDARVAVERAAGTPLALDKAHGSDSSSLDESRTWPCQSVQSIPPYSPLCTGLDGIPQKKDMPAS